MELRATIVRRWNRRDLVAVLVIGTLLTAPDHRRKVLLLLGLVAVSHLFLDALLLNVSGYSYAILWPLTVYHPPTPGLYLSSDRWPVVISAIIATIVWYVRFRHFAPKDT